VSRKQLEDIGGRGLLKRYLSLGGLLRTIYPDFNWDDTRFVHAKILQWKRLENQRAFLDNVAKDFGIHQVEEPNPFGASLFNSSCHSADWLAQDYAEADPGEGRAKSVPLLSYSRRSSKRSIPTLQMGSLGIWASQSPTPKENWEYPPHHEYSCSSWRSPRYQKGLPSLLLQSY